MTTTECDLLRMLYELTEIVYHGLPENGYGRERVENMRTYVRSVYAESAYDGEPHVAAD